MTLTDMSKISTQLQEIKQQIESLPGSYRFLYTEPKSISSPYIFVGLNPGGKVDDVSDLYVEEDNAYVHEKWNKSGKGYNPLQQQVIYFFQQMADHLGHNEWIKFMSENWLISNYVFYRSPRWPEMAAKKGHIANCKAIWKKLFAENSPKIIVANGYDTYENMILLMFEAGWSKLSEDRAAKPWDGPHVSILQRDHNRCLVIGFAHLSTYKIIKRDENKAVMANVYRLIKKYY